MSRIKVTTIVYVVLSNVGSESRKRDDGFTWVFNSRDNALSVATKKEYVKKVRLNGYINL